MGERLNGTAHTERERYPSAGVEFGWLAGWLTDKGRLCILDYRGEFGGRDFVLGFGGCITPQIRLTCTCGLHRKQLARFISRNISFNQHGS